ncbi:MAG: deoxyribose-phosphate aldolase [Bacteriovoracia bacterium]
MAKITLPSPSHIQSLLQKSKAGTPVGAEELRWLAPLIDHTLLKPDATEEQVRQLCAEALHFGFATVCVYPKFLPLCGELLAGSAVLPIAVIGFPTGKESTEQKVSEAKDAVAKGAKEIDMVLNTDLLKARFLRPVYGDIRKVVQAAGQVPVKVILETCLLSNEEKILACALAKASGAAFVKTSTGFAANGATVADIALMRAAVGSDMGVKASGGIRSTENALEMILAGADRLGASASVAIVGGKSETGAGY